MFVCKEATHSQFLLLLAVFTFSLYANTFSSGYVWDDRAAIVGNADVHQNAPIWNLFWHDFWGQDITLDGSHKSYRPITVLSYRLNYYLTELSPCGFHVGNVLIYVATVCVFYLASVRWISVQGSRVASLLFAAHPVHCEAVSSLVGRADCLSGLFFITALVFYSDGLGRLRICSSSSSHHDGRVVYSNFFLALLFGLAASLSKEIGLTVFGLFAMLEVLYVSSLSYKAPKHFLKAFALQRMGPCGMGGCVAFASRDDKERFGCSEELTRWVFWVNERETSGESLSLRTLMSLVTCSSPFSLPLRVMSYLQDVWIPTKTPGSVSDSDSDSDSDTGGHSRDSSGISSKRIEPNRPLFTRYKSCLGCLMWFFKFPIGVYCRLALHAFCLLAIIIFRSYLHGHSRIYAWTIMENPISLEPSQLTRALSYAHTHFLMVMKILNPLTPHLCFDYGHYCLPIISNLTNPLNLFSAGVYFALSYGMLDALLLAKRSRLFALMLFLLPLVPALNILFPVGTTLAERLLFVPSMGMALVIGEGCAHGLEHIWYPIGVHWSSLVGQWKSIKAAGGGSSTTTSKRTISAFTRFAMWTSLIPIICIMSRRVVDRNTEWRDEYSIYSSALAVCPFNYKALTNTGMLLLNQDKRRNAAEAAALSDRALTVYDLHPTALLNSALSHAANQAFVKAMYRFKQAERLEKSTDFKLLYQYMGGTLNDYVINLSSRSEIPATFLHDSDEECGNIPDAINCGHPTGRIDAWHRAIEELTSDAATLLDQSLTLGMNKPIALFSRASISLSIGTPAELQRAVELLDTVIQQNSHLLKLKAQGVPVEDTIAMENAYNQRALALMGLGRNLEAKEDFLLAVEINPKLWEGYINLASLYFEINDASTAKRVLETGAEVYKSTVAGPLHLTFLIQLGYAEELVGKYPQALMYYQRGLEVVEECRTGGWTYDASHENKLKNNARKMERMLV